MTNRVCGGARECPSHAGPLIANRHDVAVDKPPVAACTLGPMTSCTVISTTITTSTTYVGRVFVRD